MGFAQAGSLLTSRIRHATQTRGFAEARLLTQWDAIVGPAIAAIARPKTVSYARGGFGATLVVTARGTDAPVLDLQRDEIRARVNSCYGYNAIQRVRIEQLGPGRAPGFAEAAAPYAAEAPEPASCPVTPGLANVKDVGLRTALESLGESVGSRNAPPKNGRSSS